ncbi:MAG: TlyA family rRNA (cytidine-2'-O)-methyltransferase [Bdellovibrionales bacterium CG10_big_fil_rev_8_21_14_0_10_45_34]|nr:MAG: TlyA family rRNA (cytidine-2'-O)-methyltransferase [Bdellovibrionales bacterium CG10_big_fil_rev_8_21_14_0_10_45_34]
MLKRIDLLLVELGIAETRSKAQDLIGEGAVAVDGKMILKPSEKFSEDLMRESVFLKESQTQKYVSRGGLKIESVCRRFPLLAALQGAGCIDIGQSTGGFTDFLLKSGAKSVVGIEVGSGQIHPSLRTDPRVVTLEKTHFLSLTTEDLRRLKLAETYGIGVWDVSFISSLPIVKHLAEFLKTNALAVGLIKPQFEYSRYTDDLKKFSAQNIANNLFGDLEDMAKTAGFETIEFFESGVAGRDGNQEYFLILRKIASIKDEIK